MQVACQEEHIIDSNGKTFNINSAYVRQKNESIYIDEKCKIAEKFFTFKNYNNDH